MAKKQITLVGGLEQITGKPMDEEERSAVELWEKGKALQQLYGTFLWDIIIDTLRQFGEDAVENLMKIDPKNKEDVLAEHAVAYAANRIYVEFVNAITSEVQAAEHPPKILKTGAMQAYRQGPPDLQL